MASARVTAPWNISERQVLITGATNGIGLAAAMQLARDGALLGITARSKERGERAREAIRRVARDGKAPDVFYADLSSQAEVRRLANEVLGSYSRLDVLVNNAGAVNPQRIVTSDQLELTWATNHLAPFLLTNLLLDLLKRSAPARIITTSSIAHRGNSISFDDLEALISYKPFRRYGESKLANIVFTRELASRLDGTGVVANCFHPGLVASGFNRDNLRMRSIMMRAARKFMRSTESGATTLVYLAESPKAGSSSGEYYVRTKRHRPSAFARDPFVAARLWRASEQQTGLDLEHRTSMPREQH